MAERDLDVVVFGATGVTGRRVAAYLAEQGANWAPAARDADKLTRVLAEEGVEPPEPIVADLGDAGSLAAMAARTKVVLDLVGPYTLYGRPVIEACIDNGAHYLDLTGEIPFVREINRELGDRARDAGVKVAEVSGFESLPPDLLVLLAAETARERWGEELASADLETTWNPPSSFMKLEDMLSGGTMQSIAEIAGHPDAGCITDPAALVEDPGFAARVRDRSPIAIAPRRVDGGHVLAPMQPAAFINPAIIHRTAELTGSSPFRYREGIIVPGPAAALPLRWAAAGAVSAMQLGLKTGARARPGIRRRVSKTMRGVLPKSGFGPSGDNIGAWRWSMVVKAVTTRGKPLRTEVSAEGHPGYLTTARMLGEAGLLLAEDGATPDRAGCLTPAAALGTASIDRFERARMRFSVGS